ncbi:hypothetical protein NQ166_08785 [Microbacterium sp. zg.Y1090]|uniref:hypothetical protein n=1 Tax=Microbacterium wangruii TaxID=3049073 RepID=UPI00214DD0C0|nr:MULTISPECIES: hypothetical protein [unclassified Microbacterium]MCR2818921.1 hypothetical protein [Microbacterium sp. zg.Y1090]WIM27228.1 hypothetical protein QNO26_08595 [Microbacterium sp. zg-Y1090]
MTGPQKRRALGAEQSFVLRERPLRDGYELRDTARYADAEWQLAPASVQKQARGLTLRFNRVPEQFRGMHRWLMFTMLSGVLPPGEDRASIPTIIATHYSLITFYRWLDLENGGRPMSTVTGSNLERYQLHLLLKYPGSYGRRHALRAAVRYLWRYRQCLGSDGLTSDPIRVRGWGEAHSSSGSGENSTPRIPELVHSRLLVWALRFVDDFADDILQASDRWEDLRVIRRRSYTPQGVTASKIAAYLQDRVDAGRPLPGFNGHVNYAAIARSVDCTRRALDLHDEAIHNAVDAVGVSDFAYLGVSVRGKLDGAAWTEGVSLDPSRDDSIASLTQVLQAACYIVVAFLSGMRDSEVKHLRRGACEARLDANGEPYRWFVRSTAFKGELEAEGVPATWVVAPPVATALAVLERVHDNRARGRNEWLFGPIKSGPGAGSAGRGGNVAMTTAGTNRQLNRFIQWVNAYCTTHNRADRIPDVDGRPWKLSTRQFRRTLAWYIARRPGGSIAGAIQYRHHSIQMFEGYAGTSDSGFRAEVEAEEAILRGETLQALIDQHEHLDLFGPARADAASRLAALAQDPGFAGQVTTDRRRLIRLASAKGAEIYPGKYVTCVYNPDKALCRAGRQPTTGPDLNACKPLACKNVALDSANISAWLEELTELDVALSAPSVLPPALLVSLQARRDQVQRLLANSQNGAGHDPARELAD